MKKEPLTGFLVLLGVILGCWYYALGGAALLGQLPFEYADKFISLIVVVASLTILYKIGSLFLRSVLVKSGAKGGEVIMIKGVFRFFLIVVGCLTIVTYWFSLGSLGAIFAAFGGMFLGWSLQGPISGLAAWLLVSIIRPFSVGDRVQLPSYGLVGDVISISPLYTTLNQVGGSVGSEEPANRTVLIPNAMLFGALVINYTPKDQEELIKQAQSKMQASSSPEPTYMLDEFVLRMSFDSDWDEAERVLLNAAREVTADIIKATGQEPYIRADMSDWYGVSMRLRFMTHATNRPRIMHEISEKVFKAIQSSDKVDLAIPYIYSFKKGVQWAPPLSIENLETLRRIKPNYIEEKIVCSRCAAENSTDAMYCSKCGERLNQPTHNVANKSTKA